MWSAVSHANIYISGPKRHQGFAPYARLDKPKGPIWDDHTGSSRLLLHPHLLGSFEHLAANVLLLPARTSRGVAR